MTENSPKMFDAWSKSWGFLKRQQSEFRGLHHPEFKELIC